MGAGLMGSWWETGRRVRCVSWVCWAWGSPFCGMKSSVGLDGILGQGQGLTVSELLDPYVISRFPSPSKPESSRWGRVWEVGAASARDMCPQQAAGQQVRSHLHSWKHLKI